jgi:hypothetical protein
LAALVPRTRTEGGHLRNVVCHQALRFWINSTMVISRPGADPDGEAGGPDATVDVELLPAGFFVPSADVGRLKAAEAEAATEELERQLAAVGVASQRQVDAQLGRPVEVVGIVAQLEC